MRLIIFDWDDVFTIGSTKGYIACYHNALKGVGIELDPVAERKRINTKWGKSHREELTELLKEHPDLVDKACEICESNLFGETFVNELSVIPGTQDMLQRISKKYTLAIATGVHPKLLKEQVMPKFKIPEVFSQIITAYDISNPELQKPNPYSLQTIMRTQGASNKETIFVGDAENDVKMAVTAGVTPVVALTGHLTSAQAEKLGVKHIIENVGQIESILKTLDN